MMRKAVLFFVACVGVVPTFAQSYQTIPSMVNTSGAPVRIVSVMGTLDDFMHEVTIKNLSDRPIVSLKIGFIMAVPTACGPSAYSDEKILREDRLQLPAAGTAVLHDYMINPHQLVQFQHDHAAKGVRSQIAVTDVKYADGGSWEIDSSNRIYDEQKLQRDGESQCGMSVADIRRRESVVCQTISPNATGHYTCQSGAGSTCNNAGSSCTNISCQDQNDCPDQQCSGLIQPVNPPK